MVVEGNFPGFYYSCSILLVDYVTTFLTRKVSALSLQLTELPSN